MNPENDIMTKIKVRFPNFYVTYVVDNDMRFDPEDDNGYVEYKRSLTSCDNFKIEKYATQMYWRISENRKNRATYFIGVDDDGTVIGLTDDEIIDSVNKIVTIISKINASVMCTKIIEINNSKIMEFKIRKKKIPNTFMVDFDIY